ncbi:MAG: prepilin-type N-terminal cleavage/methylation domain-containing protein [Chloroflexi bacterium]|nr:prepilin-type N-terminal cleavage/methylation domain-containing protein [Chloroflexota bacterium]
MKSLVLQRLRDQRGVSLIEAVAAMALLTLVMGGVMAGLSTFHISSTKSALQASAENIARNQMEYVFEQSYLPPGTAYEAITLPQDFSVATETVEHVAGDSNVERVRVTVYHQGTEVLSVETLRVNNQ